MNVLFVTLVGINSIEDRGIYQDLLRQFRNKGHDVTIVTPVERRKGIAANYRQKDGVSILQVKTLNVTKTNLIEKGVGTVLLEYQFLSAIKKYMSTKKFDLVLYSTPPITFSRVIQFIKKRDNAKSYLLLKDIFPQNAVDLGMMKRDGILHRFFQRKEKQLYKVSDYIGCMSPANVNYVLKHNPEISPARVEVCPNSIEPVEEAAGKNDMLRSQYNIPAEATLYIYGGNLGKPQGLDFLMEVLETNNNKPDRFFIVIGSGTEKQRLNDWFQSHPLSNAVMLDGLPKVAYDQLVRSCDVGLIFLDKRFTIPNYPSRLLSYLENKMPVLVASDTNTDAGPIAEENGYGLWAEHGDIDKFNALIDVFCENPELRKQMGEKGYRYLMENYTVERSYEVIMFSTNCTN
ncbi:glycosyltransferase family 4 protein [Macellibacteroides fermentans]|uniref:glycosyltransferase family 4 protein n=1 Tax=Macellibacteroides fermentans TaxID=879969 RepID=UPI00352F5532